MYKEILFNQLMDTGRKTQVEVGNVECRNSEKMKGDNPQVQMIYRRQYIHSREYINGEMRKVT